MIYILFLFVFTWLICIELDKVQLQKRVEILLQIQEKQLEAMKLMRFILETLSEDSHPAQEIDPRVDSRLVHHGLISDDAS